MTAPTRPEEDAITSENHSGTAGSVGPCLVALIADLLGVESDQVSADRPLGELGIDSLTAAELSVEVEERTGVQVPLGQFLGDRTLDELVRELDNSAAAGGGGATEGARA